MFPISCIVIFLLESKAPNDSRSTCQDDRDAVLKYRNIMLCCIIMYFVVLCCIVLHCVVLCCIKSHSIVPFRTVLY